MSGQHQVSQADLSQDEQAQERPRATLSHPSQRGACDGGGGIGAISRSQDCHWAAD